MNSSTAALSVLTLHYSCVSSTGGLYTYTAWYAVYLLLLPMFLLVLYIGFMKWWKHRDSATVSISHCDALTFHMVAQEMIMTAAGSMLVFGLYRRQVWASVTGISLFGFTMSGQAILHSFTCLERYLAVVHPIIYLRLKRRGGVYIRNVSIASAWLLSVVYTLLIVLSPNITIVIVVHLVLVSVVLATVIFCSISVLCALIGPGPGERGGDRKWIDRSKLWSFAVIMTILGVLVMRLVQMVGLAFWPVLPQVDPCALTISSFYFSLPSSLVLPLLFLHRNGRLSACC